MVNETLAPHGDNDTATVWAIGRPTELSATTTTTATGHPGVLLITTLAAPDLAGNVGRGLINLNSSSLTSQTIQSVPNSPRTDLTSYLGGANSVALTVGSQGIQSGSVPSGVFGRNTGTANETVTIAHSHISLIDLAPDPVPEPASMAIWGLGALGCAIAGYRRRVPPANSTSS
jgi:hypothetical protein